MQLKIKVLKANIVILIHLSPMIFDFITLESKPVYYEG